METIAGISGILIVLAIIIGLFVVALLGFLMPLFVYQIAKRQTLLIRELKHVNKGLAAFHADHLEVMTNMDVVIEKDDDSA